MSKQSSHHNCGFHKNKPQRQSDESSDVQVRLIENNKEGRSCQREFEGEENKMTPNERDVQEWKN